MSHPSVANGVVCVDFDATIFPWGKVLNDYENEPFPGVVEAMQRLRREGYRIVILTSRLSKTWAKSEVGDNGWEQAIFLDQQHAFISEMLTKHDIPFDLITSEKVPALAYIDDKAMEVINHEDRVGLWDTATTINLFLHRERHKEAASVAA